MFGLWRARIVELKILAELNRTSKKMILEKISKIIEMTSKESVISAIRKFQINRKVQAVQKNFLRRLLQSKTGKLAESFNVWKSIPLQNLAVKYKKYQKLYFQLESLRRARLTTVQACFKDEQADGNTMKKQSILRILDVTSLGIRKLYSRWEKLTKRKKMLLTVNFTI